MARCKHCGRFIKQKYFERTGLCYRCYKKNKNISDYNKFNKPFVYDSRDTKLNNKKETVFDKIIGFFGVLWDLVTFLFWIGIIFVLIYFLITGWVKNSEDETIIEGKILEVVNEERESVGVWTLSKNQNLYSFAKDHSIRMNEESFFEHSNGFFGENIAESPTWYWVNGCGPTITNNQMAYCIYHCWLFSPPHYQNMINPRYSITGIGVSCNFFGCKVTQIFD